MVPYRCIWPHNLLWEVDHDSSYGLLTDWVYYLTPQFIVGGVPAMGPYRFIWPRNLLWEVDHDSRYGLLTDWVYYLTSPGGRCPSNGSLQIYLTSQLMWEVDHDSSYGLLTDWVNIVLLPLYLGGVPGIQLWTLGIYIWPHKVGGDPAMGPYRFCFFSDPTIYCGDHDSSYGLLTEKSYILYFAPLYGRWTSYLAIVHSQCCVAHWQRSNSPIINAHCSSKQFMSYTINSQTQWQHKKILLI